MIPLLLAGAGLGKAGGAVLPYLGQRYARDNAAAAEDARFNFAANNQAVEGEADWNALMQALTLGDQQNDRLDSYLTALRGNVAKRAGARQASAGRVKAAATSDQARLGAKPVNRLEVAARGDRAAADAAALDATALNAAQGAGTEFDQQAGMDYANGAADVRQQYLAALRGQQLGRVQRRSNQQLAKSRLPSGAPGNRSYNLQLLGALMGLGGDAAAGALGGMGVAG